MMTSELTLASPERLEELLKETNNELDGLQPRIEELESCVLELKELKRAKQRLLTLKMSLAALIETSNKEDELELSIDVDHVFETQHQVEKLNFDVLSASKTFHPDHAFKEVSRFLRQKGSLNYEIFKAIVFSGGKATTEEIKTYLVDSDIKQPQSGKPFASVPLTAISSRANYLVRKGVLQSHERGCFFSTLGWVAEGETV